MDSPPTDVIWKLLLVTTGGVILVLSHFFLLLVLGSFSASGFAQREQDQAREDPSTQNIEDKSPLLLPLPPTSITAKPSRGDTEPAIPIVPTRTLIGSPSISNQKSRLEERKTTLTSLLHSAFERKPPVEFIRRTLAAIDLSGERQLPVPRKVLARLVINLNASDGLNGPDGKIESYVHHKYFRIPWQNAASFIKCTKTAESYLRNRLDSQHSFFMSSSQYRILKHAAPDSSETWMALRARQTQSGNQPYEIELDSESVQNIGGWKWNLPRMLSDHMNKDPDAVLFLEIALSYTRYTPHPIDACGGTGCASAIRIALLAERILLPKSPLNHVTDAWFISGKLIEQYFTKELIEHLINHDVELRRDVRWLTLSDNDKKDFVNKIHMFRTRLLASSILARLDLRYIFYLTMAGIKDVDIPLKIEHKKLLPFLSPNDSGIDFEEFIRYQGSCKAHSFPDSDSPQHKPSNKHVEPIPREHEIVPDNVVIPVLEAEPLENGKNALVYRIRLHGDHHKFSPDRNKYFALKRIVRDSKLNDISHESKILAKLSAVPHMHLTPLLASWQQGDSCSILLPLAKENLYSMMTNGTQPKLDGCFVRWLLKQMAGLAAGLNHIHNLGPADLGPEPGNTVKDGNRSKSGYHHDLHPSNILVFDGDVLKISDFGTARIQQVLGSGQISYVSRRAVCNSDYEAPENVLNQRASRPHDVWALGCIFLEMLVWASGHSVKEFYNARFHALETEEQNIHDASFWYNRGGKAELKSSVKNKIRTLRLQHVNKFVFQTLLTLVEHMLRIESQPDKPNCRILISNACSTLQTMIPQAELDLRNGENFFTETCPPTVGSTYAPPSEVMTSREPSEIGDGDHGSKEIEPNHLLQVPKAPTRSRRRSTGDLLKLAQFPNLSVNTRAPVTQSDLQSDLAHTGGQHTGAADSTSTPKTPILKFTDHDDDQQRFFTADSTMTPPYSNGSRGSGPSTPQSELDDGHGYTSSRVDLGDLGDLEGFGQRYNLIGP